MVSSIKKIKTPILIVLFYFVGHFFLLLNRGIYWDGLHMLSVLFTKKYDLLWQYLDMHGTMGQQLYYTIRIIGLTPNPVVAIKFIAFFSWLIAGIVLYVLLKNKFNVPERESFFIAASYLLLPSFLVKLDIPVLHYSISNMLFILAAYLYFTAGNNWIKLIFSSLLFFFSFFTNSFLGFFGAFLIIMFLENSFKLNKKQLLFVSLPFIFWIARHFFGVPYGAAFSYNQFVFFKPHFLSGLIRDFWNGISYGFFWQLIAPIAILQRKIFAALAIIIFSIFYFSTKNLKSESTNHFNYLVGGALFFMFGLLPYLLVGKPPHIFGYGFAMRNALLLPLGISLLLSGTILHVIKTGWQRIIQIALLSLFAVFSIYNYYRFDMDWYKQQAIITAFRDTKDQRILNASTLVITDKTSGFNYQDRQISSGDFQGWLFYAFYNKDFKFAVKENENINEEFERVKDFHTLPYPDNFNPFKNVVHVSIISGGGTSSTNENEIMTVYEWLKLKKLELFNSSDNFTNALKKDLQITINI